MYVYIIQYIKLKVEGALTLLQMIRLVKVWGEGDYKKGPSFKYPVSLVKFLQNYER